MGNSVRSSNWLPIKSGIYREYEYPKRSLAPSDSHTLVIVNGKIIEVNGKKRMFDHQHLAALVDLNGFNQLK